MALENVLGDKSPQMRLEHGESVFEMWTLQGGIFVTRVHGFGHASFEAHIKPMEDAITSGTTVTVFHDWQAGTDYDHHLQLLMVNWTRNHRKSIRSITLLTSSSILGMAVATGNLLLSTSDFRMQHFREREKFEATLRLALEKAAPQRT